MLSGAPRRKIQIITRLYDSKADVLNGFDIDCCCLGFDGQDALITKRAAIAIASKVNTINLEIRGEAYENRLIKYAERGFGIGVPRLRQLNLDKEYEKPMRRSSAPAPMLLSAFILFYQPDSFVNLFSLMSRLQRFTADSVRQAVSTQCSSDTAQHQLFLICRYLSCKVEMGWFDYETLAGDGWSKWTMATNLERLLLAESHAMTLGIIEKRTATSIWRGNVSLSSPLRHTVRRMSALQRSQVG
jgi:hypothetical protein